MVRITAGKFKNRKLLETHSLKLRPTTNFLKQAYFNVVKNRLENAVFLDLFAGTGNIGLEGLSRGAKNVWFVEKDLTILACLKKNIALLDVEDQTRVIASPVTKALNLFKKQEIVFDLVYLDPPYNMIQKELIDICYSLTTELKLKKSALIAVEFGTSIIFPDRHLLLETRRYGSSFLHLLQPYSED